MAVLDTSALIHILTGSDQGREIKEKHGDTAISITSFSLYELVIGEKNKEQAIEFCKGFEIISFDSEAAERSLDIEKSLKKKGKMIGQIDIFIASICIIHNLELITSDKDFLKVDDLNVKMI